MKMIKQKTVSPNVSKLLKKEQKKGMRSRAYYANFQEKALKIKWIL